MTKKERMYKNKIWQRTYQKKHRIAIHNRVVLWNITTRYDLDRLKNRPCTDCSGWFHPCQMDWDHVRGKKLGSVSSFRSSRARKKLVEEMAKCELVCANCHRLRTFKVKGY